MGKLFTDTSDFFAIDCGDEILIGDQRYKVTGHERERRFGIEDPKFWVKRVNDPETGENKIVKLSYFESFDTTLGGVKIRCFRSPEKEAEILRFVKDLLFSCTENLLRTKKETTSGFWMSSGGKIFMFTSSL